MKKIIYTIDVEPDLHDGGFKGITEGLKKAEEIFDKYKIKPILFVTCDVLKKYPKIFQKLKKKEYSLGLHGLTHKRIDLLTKEEKEQEIRESLACFQKYLKIKPRAFRAVQHSIDSETLDLLESNGFYYDSSLTPLNFLQIIWFPKKKQSWKYFFSKLNSYKIRKNLLEIPPSSLFFPFVSLILRIFPKFCLKIYISLLKLFYKNPVFYCHSWDFIELPNSKTDKLFPRTLFIEKLEYIIKNELKK